MRTNKLVSGKQVHKGAINAINVNASNYIITGSADKQIKMFDILGGFK